VIRSEGGELDVNAGEPFRNAGFGWAEAFFNYPYLAPARAVPILQVVTQKVRLAQRNLSSFQKKLSIG
jgi:hypothetical protein